MGTLKLLTLKQSHHQENSRCTSFCLSSLSLWPLRPAMATAMAVAMVMAADTVMAVDTDMAPGATATGATAMARGLLMLRLTPPFSTLVPTTATLVPSATATLAFP